MLNADDVKHYTDAALQNSLSECFIEVIKNDVAKLSKKYTFVNGVDVEDANGNIRRFYRIKALRNIYNPYGEIICHKGDWGGYIMSEANLSQDGECWVDEYSRIEDEACISGNAQVFSSVVEGNVHIYGNAHVMNSVIDGDVGISDNAHVHFCNITCVSPADPDNDCYDCYIHDNTHVYYSQIVGKLKVADNVHVGSCCICGNVNISGNVRVQGGLSSCTTVNLLGETHLHDNVVVDGFNGMIIINNSTIQGDAKIKAHTFFNEDICKKARQNDRDFDAIIIDGAVIEDRAVIKDKVRVLAASTVSGNAIVSDSVVISGGALVCDNAEVIGSAQILDSAVVSGNALISGRVIVSKAASVGGNARISDDVIISGNASVSGLTTIKNSCKINGNAIVSDNAKISNFVQVTDDAKIYGSVRLHDNIMVCGKAELDGYMRLYGIAILNEDKLYDSFDALPDGIAIEPTDGSDE